MINRTKTLMAKKRTKSDRDAVSEVDAVPEQRKRPEEGRYCLQVDRQTKSSYPTYEDAEEAALIIKKGHPVVRVVVHDTVEGVHKVIELP
jgi:hypothetical protein